MSKSALKKELENMSAEQLRQIILDAYNVNPEFKQYFDFFLNPDVSKYREKKLDLIKKELNRSKWGSSKARTSVINKIVKEFIAYNIGAEETILFMLHTLQLICLFETSLRYKDTHFNYIARLTKEMISYANEYQLADKCMELLTEGVLEHEQLTRTTKLTVKDAIDDALNR
ncbi:MAG: DUF6155 family protein [Muribaculaceae bacterium]